MNNVKRAPYLFALPFVISFLLFFLYPVIDMFIMSFHKMEGISSSVFIGLDNYKRLFSDPHLGMAVSNSILFTIGILITNVVFGVLLAVVLNNKLTPFRNIFRSALFLPSLTSIIVAGIYFRLFFGGGDQTPLNALMSFFHLRVREWLYDNQTSGLIALVITSTWRWLGINTMYFICGLQSIPDELYEAADIDGANSIKKFWYITVPGLKPMLIFVITTLTYGGLRMFGESYVLWINGSTPGDIGLTIVLYIYKTAFAHFDNGYASALSVVLFICLMLINLIYIKLLGIGKREGSH
ncbi:MAG: L-arabinose transport system permease protein AraP [Thermocaproicibacter melissae]|jgi:arabinosaccharide transport system permease protein